MREFSWTFIRASGSPCSPDRGGEHRAIIASLIGTCRLTDVNAHAYLTVGGHPHSRIDNLLPWRYAAPAGV